LGGTSSAANGINDSGTIVGNAFLTGNTFPHAFSYSGGVMTDLGTLGGNASYGLGINSGGVIVGFAEAVASGPLRAFISNNGTMTDLGTLGGTRSAAYDINDSGTVVGQADLANGTQHAFVNLNGGGMEDLNSDVVNLGSFTLVQARGVNESGQIAVWGTDTESGSLHAFLLTPQEVPEASTWAAIAALSLAGVAQWRRSKRA
jgi:probable HAF family extracellular repeat protein